MATSTLTEQPANQSSIPQSYFRHSLIRSVFGKTKKSPFVWGVDTDRHKQLSDSLHVLHNDKQLPMHSLEDVSIDDYSNGILVVALSAYSSDASASSMFDDSFVAESSLLNQLVSIELLLWQSINNEQLAKEIGQPIVAKFEKTIGDTLDSDGWPLGKVANELVLLIASWLRCHKLLDFVGYEIAPDATDLLNGLALQIGRLILRDDTLMFGRGSSGFQCNAFKRILAEQWSNNDATPFKLNRKKARTLRLPAVSSISEWAQIGTVRNGWLRNDNKVGFKFHDQRIELQIDNGNPIVSGDCTPTLIRDGVEVPMNSEIGVTCFLRFDCGDFVELEMEYENLTIARQILLLSTDELLLVNDVVFSNSPSHIRYQCGFPVPQSNGLIKETENNEVYVKCGDDFTLVLPLFLPEWKAERSSGRLNIENNALKVTDEVKGLGMSVPLIFDLNPKRSQQPRTWRRLTVAEQMQIVGSDIAAAYRAQIGNDQWLFYRSVGPKGNRTFMGQNFADDFFVGKIDLEGNVESLLEIE